MLPTTNTAIDGLYRSDCSRIVAACQMYFAPIKPGLQVYEFYLNVATPLAAGNGPYDEKGLGSHRDRVGQGGVRRLMRYILLAGEEPNERSALLRDVVADRPAQHRIAGLQCVEDRALRGLTLDVELHLAVDLRQRSQMYREYDSDHGSGWTSPDATAGRSRTMGAQLSPASADAYTCPPVVPKYTPHESSESTAIASRSTLT